MRQGVSWPRWPVSEFAIDVLDPWAFSYPDSQLLFEFISKICRIFFLCEPGGAKRKIKRKQDRIKVLRGTPGYSVTWLAVMEALLLIETLMQTFSQLEYNLDKEELRFLNGTST